MRKPHDHTVIGSGSERMLRRAMLGIISGGLVAPIVGLSTQGHAQSGADWPNRSVRYINIFPPGGATDTLSRL